MEYGYFITLGALAHGLDVWRVESRFFELVVDRGAEGDLLIFVFFSSETVFDFFSSIVEVWVEVVIRHLGVALVGPVMKSKNSPYPC